MIRVNLHTTLNVKGEHAPGTLHGVCLGYEAQWLGTYMCRIRCDTCVRAVVVAHLFCVLFQNPDAECDFLFALTASLRFCMLLAHAMIPAEMRGIGFTDVVNVEFLVLGQHCALEVHHLAKQASAAAGPTIDTIFSVGDLCWEYRALRVLPSFLHAWLMTCLAIGSSRPLQTGVSTSSSHVLQLMLDTCP